MHKEDALGDNPPPYLQHTIGFPIRAKAGSESCHNLTNRSALSRSHLLPYNRAMQTKSNNPTASAGEWSYLRGEAFWLLVAFALGSGALLYFLNNDRSTTFIANTLIVTQIALAGLSYLAFRWQARAGQSL